MKLSLTAEQQREMRRAHYDGAPGVLVSGLVWLSAALVCARVGMSVAVWVLLVGGALIHPLGTFLTRMLGRPARTGRSNALNQLAMASTVWLILCCIMAYGLGLQNPLFFFPAMMATIGSRYLVFATVFGMPFYWMLGSVLVVAGGAAFLFAMLPAMSAAIGGAIEILGAMVAFARAMEPAASPAAGADG